MGAEYALRFRHPGPEAVIRVLERLPALQKPGPGPTDFELRTQSAAGEMPDASLRIEADGLYFCDFGGAGRQLLGEVIARLVGEFGAVTVSELE